MKHRGLHRCHGAILAGLFALSAWILPGDTARANWSLNIGYRNPPQSGLGVNFLFSWTQVALELGICSLDLDGNFDNDKGSQKDDDGIGLGLAGDINGKFYLSSGGVRPYLQIGTLLGSYGAVGDKSGLGLGSGEIFFGGGLWFGQVSSVHGYLSYNVLNDDGFLQAGLGFDIESRGG